MFNLLNAEFYKLRKSKAIYIGVLVASILALLLYGSLVMIDKINQGEVANGTAGIIVSQVDESVNDSGAPKSMMREIGIVGVLQQSFCGNYRSGIGKYFRDTGIFRRYS